MRPNYKSIFIGKSIFDSVSQLNFVFEIEVERRSSCEISESIVGLSYFEYFEIAVSLRVGFFKDYRRNIVEDRFTVYLAKEVIN